MLIVAFIFCLKGCSESPKEQIIRENLEKLEAAIEDKEPIKALGFIHPNFTSDKGADREWIKRTMALYSLRHDQINIIISNVLISAKDPHTMLAEFHALTTGGKGLLPEQGGLYQVHTQWRKEDGDWKLVYAKWKRG